MDNSHRFFKNSECKYFPCHDTGQMDFNCLFCYCPMYRLESCPGNPVFVEKNGKQLKVCKDCSFPHNPDNYDTIMEILKKANT